MNLSEKLNAMTLEQRKVLLQTLAVVETVHEMGGKVPATPIMMALDHDINQFDIVLSVAENMNWLKKTSTHVLITDEGKAMMARRLAR